jgi:hypothetical protein
MMRAMSRIGRRLRWAGMVLIGLVVSLWPAVTRSQAGLSLPSGVSHVRLGPRVVVAGGGGAWVVRSWRQPAKGSSPPSSEDCLQVGQLQGARLVRNVYGRERVMRFRDRSVCGATAFGRGQPVDPQLAPLLVERLLSRSGTASVVFAHTIVAGIVPAGIRGVALDAAGRRVPVAFSAASRTFLAVLPGSVRRLDLRLVFLRARGRQVVDFGTGTTGAGGVSPMVRGSLTTPIVLNATGLTTPLALVVYRVRESTVHGPLIEPCAEPGRVIAGEPGDYNASWADFLDAPTLVGLSEFNDGWAPSGPTASEASSCLNGFDDYSGGPVGGLGVQRLDASLVGVYGFLAPGITGLQVTARSGQQSDAVIDPSSRAFLVVVRSTGSVGDHVRLTAIGGHPKKRAETVALGEQRVPQPFRYQLRDRRRTIYVAWDGGGLPFAGAEVVRAGDRVRVSVLDLYPPDFAPDGTGYGIAGIGTYSCANIRLYAPLPAGAAIVDASNGRRIGPSKLLPGPHQFRCPNVRPGQRVDIPWVKTLRSKTSAGL